MSALKAPLSNNSSLNIRLNGHGNGNVPHWRSAMAQPAGDYSRAYFSCSKFYTPRHFPEFLRFSSIRGTWCQAWPRSLCCHSHCQEFCAGNSAQFPEFCWISGWFPHVTPHSRQCAPGAVLAALRATFGSVTKEGAAAAGKCGVSSISAWVPPSWPREGEEQLFGFYLHGMTPLEGEGNIEKLCAVELKPRKLQQEIWEIPSPRSWNSGGGPAAFEEEPGGDPVLWSLNQKHSSSTGNFSLEFSSSRGSLGRKGRKAFHSCQMPAKSISNKPCTCVCLFLEFS